MPTKEYYAELIRKMKIIDECSKEIDDNDVVIPQKIKETFDNNDSYTDISILKMMLDNSLDVLKEYAPKEYKQINSLSTYEKLLHLLETNYEKDYLPTLKSFGLGESLR